MELLGYTDGDGCVGDAAVLRSMMQRRVRGRCIDWLRQRKRRTRSVGYSAKSRRWATSSCNTALRAAES